jgi:hypothetical protein
MDGVSNEEYRFERLAPEHYKDLNYISESAFGFKPGIDYYQNKNATEKFGEANLGFIAYHVETNEPAAFYGVYSYPVRLNGKSILAVQSGDTMTHRNHTGKGLFIKLARMTYELAQQKGAMFVFGFPNENSYPGFVKKLNWKHDGNVQLFKINVPTLPLLKAAKKIKPFGYFYKIYFKCMASFYLSDEQFFQNSNDTPNSFYVDHNNEFFQYKSFAGNCVVKIAGFKIWIKPDGFLYVGDIEKAAAEKKSYFLKQLKTFAFLIGADKIIFGASKNSFWYSELHSILKPEEGIYFGYCDFSNSLPMDRFQYVFGDLDTF